MGLMCIPFNKYKYVKNGTTFPKIGKVSIYLSIFLFIKAFLKICINMNIFILLMVFSVFLCMSNFVSLSKNLPENQNGGL